MGMIISRLMGLATIGASLANVALLQRFLEGVIGIIALTIVGAMMAGMLLVSGFYGIYLGLIYYGLEPLAAGITVVGLVLALTVCVASILIARLRQLREIPYTTLHHSLPPLHRAGNLLHAFLQGFVHSPRIISRP